MQVLDTYKAKVDFQYIIDGVEPERLSKVNDLQAEHDRKLAKEIDRIDNEYRKHVSCWDESLRQGPVLKHLQYLSKVQAIQEDFLPVVSIQMHTNSYFTDATAPRYPKLCLGKTNRLTLGLP